MLRELFIKNVAVIDELNIDLEPGMSVLTGETGAGKSIVIDSINLVLGNKADKSLIRYGEDKATVQAVFDVSANIIKYLAENDIECEENELIITRIISQEGKSVCRLNGIAVPLAILRELAPHLINIHGQHDNQALLTASKHIAFLDAYAENSEKLSEYKKLYSDFRGLQKELDKLSINDDERLRKIDLLKYQIDEIQEADLKTGEEEELKSQRDKILNAEKITTSANLAYSLLYSGEGNSAYENVYNSVKALEKVSGIDEALDKTIESLSDIMYSLEDAAHNISDFGNLAEYDEQLLNEIEERLDLYSKIKRKYGSDVEEIEVFLKKATEEYELLSGIEENTDIIKAEIEKKQKELLKCAEDLRQSRKNAAIHLQSEIENSLHELNMEQARFIIHFDVMDDFSSDGMDNIEFLISANAGEPPKPLVKIASGGELSRVMLAMKAILAECDSVDTLIFDEIDTGVSGNAAQKIASKLEQISRFKQVVCITHLPQLASCADNHYYIEKTTKQDKTYTSISKLADEDRVLEVARITGGDVTEISKQYAEELIKKAKERKCEVQG